MQWREVQPRVSLDGYRFNWAVGSTIWCVPLWPQPSPREAQSVWLWSRSGLWQLYRGDGLVKSMHWLQSLELHCVPTWYVPSAMVNVTIKKHCLPLEALWCGYVTLWILVSHHKIPLTEMVCNIRDVLSSSSFENPCHQQSGRAAGFRTPNIQSLLCQNHISRDVEYSSRSMYLVSFFVCCLCGYETFPFPFLSKAEVIEPSQRIPFTILLRASVTSRAWSAVHTASSPQHFFACWNMFPMDCVSFPST